MPHATPAELDAALPHVLAAPSDTGVVRAIARRPAPGQREVLTEGTLDTTVGLVGDNWLARGSRSTPDGSAIPEMQVTVMNARVALLVAGSEEDMPLAGDQLYVDFDISQDNLPAGTMLAIGTAVLEVTPAPHTGCKKFVARFGADAMRFVNSREGRKLRLRGMNTRVVVPGVVRVGDAVRVTTIGAVPAQARASAPLNDAEGQRV